MPAFPKSDTERLLLEAGILTNFIRRDRSRSRKTCLTAVGFEPMRIAPPELESGALDRSAKLSLTITFNILTTASYIMAFTLSI